MKTLKIMQIAMLVAVVIGVVYGGNHLATKYATIEVVNEEVSVATSTPVVVVELSNVEKAKEQLDQAKKLLDDEENMILAEIDAREARLEEIREVRMSFSQAPNQTN